MAKGDLRVLCDFDGTITLIDTAEYILDRFAEGDWKGVEHMLERGELTIEESMKRQFEMISMPRSAIIAELDKVVKTRGGFEALMGVCGLGEGRLRITSAGLDFYIRHFLDLSGWSDLADVVAPLVTDAGDGVRFEFPRKINPAAHNFKEDEVLCEQARGMRVAYIGDGTSDLWAALSADIAFAVKGSKLDRLLDREGRSYCSFSHFQEVVDHLNGRRATSLE
jgi:2,3-diketo-5-methylthio-1-phosphopentane phosphatase